MKTDHLLFGAAYYSEYLPYDRVEKDMEMMAKAGMNTIRIAESTWSTIEPRDGVFDFTHLDKMLDAAAKHGISVIIGTPMRSRPGWQRSIQIFLHSRTTDKTFTVQDRIWISHMPDTVSTASVSSAR